MNDEQDKDSGSRWESGAETPDEDTTQLASHESAPQPVAEAPRDRRAWMRGRGAIGGAAVGIAAVFGLGGFAVGHATADDGHERPGFHRFGHHFPGDGEGRLGPRMRRDGMPGGPQQQQPPNVAPSPAPSAGGNSSSDDNSSS